MENIFLPFYSSHKDGSGIGLSFARQVMKMHQGKIGVRARPEGGTSFLLYF
jgi:signal transduction histidine kinase